MTVTDVERSAVESPPTSAPLRARPGLHYAPVPGGVYFSGTRGQFVLRGSELLYAVADGCVPLLRAGTTEDALVAEFGTERARPAVRHLLGKLRENGLLLDPAVLTEPEPPAELAARHADTLARLTARLDDPYAAFARLRRTRVRLHGPAQAAQGGPDRRDGDGRSGAADVPGPGLRSRDVRGPRPAVRQERIGRRLQGPDPRRRPGGAPLIDSRRRPGGAAASDSRRRPGGGWNRYTNSCRRPGGASPPDSCRRPGGGWNRYTNSRRRPGGERNRYANSRRRPGGERTRCHNSRRRPGGDGTCDDRGRAQGRRRVPRR